MNPVVEVLEKARALVAKSWGQGGSTDADEALIIPNAECYCAVTALGAAGVDDIKAMGSARRFLNHAIGVSCLDVIEWNDKPGRTQADVLAAYDKAIELAKASR